MHAVMTNGTLAWKTFGLLWLWFAAALGFYGISLYVGHFSGSLYKNALLSALVEFPGK